MIVTLLGRENVSPFRIRCLSVPIVENKQEVPPPYSRADDYARSLYGRRDDDYKMEPKFKTTLGSIG